MKIASLLAMTYAAIPTLIAQAEMAPIAGMASAAGIGGILIWYLYYMTSKILPAKEQAFIQAQADKDRAFLEAQAIRDRAFIAAIEAKDRAHIDEQKELVCEHKDLATRLVAEQREESKLFRDTIEKLSNQTEKMFDRSLTRIDEAIKDCRMMVHDVRGMAHVKLMDQKIEEIKHQQQAGQS